MDNTGGGAGDHVFTVIPGEDNEMEILYGLMALGAGTNHTIAVEIQDDEENRLALVAAQSISQNTERFWPAPFVTGTVVGNTNRLFVSGKMRLVGTMDNPANNQDSSFGIVARIHGKKPTVTVTGESSPLTITVLKDEIF